MLSDDITRIVTTPGIAIITGIVTVITGTAGMDIAGMGTVTGMDVTAGIRGATATWFVSAVKDSGGTRLKAPAIAGAFLFPCPQMRAGRIVQGIFSPNGEIRTIFAKPENSVASGG